MEFTRVRSFDFFYNQTPLLFQQHGRKYSSFFSQLHTFNTHYGPNSPFSSAMATLLKLKLKPNLILVFLLFFLVLCGCGYARIISDRADLVSDGVAAAELPPFLRLHAEEEACEETYGFLPCTNSGLGNLFLILLYGYLMFLAATYLSAGSELLLEILGPGIVGGLFLPILGALPDALLILGD